MIITETHYLDHSVLFFILSLSRNVQYLVCSELLKGMWTGWVQFCEAGPLHGL